MGKKGKDKKKIKGAEKTAMKTEKKIINKQKKQLAALGEVRLCPQLYFNKINLILNNFKNDLF